jgi:hypothetical protein
LPGPIHRELESGDFGEALGIECFFVRFSFLPGQGGRHRRPVGREARIGVKNLPVGFVDDAVAGEIGDSPVADP